MKQLLFCRIMNHVCAHDHLSLCAMQGCVWLLWLFAIEKCIVMLKVLAYDINRCHQQVESISQKTQPLNG
jgi:hypothetical protein